MIIKINIGKAQIEHGAKDILEAIDFIDNVERSQKCELCGNTDLYTIKKDVQYNDKNTGKPKSFTSIKRICKKCNASSSYHVKDDGGFYFKRWEIYKKDNINNKQEINEPEEYNGKMGVGEVPF